MDTNKYKEYMGYLTKQNLLYFGAAVGGFYIVKSVFGFLGNYFSSRNQNNEIRSIILINKDSSSLKHLTQHELCYYLYFKVLNSVYKKMIYDFNTRRRNHFNNLEYYIKIIAQHDDELKAINENTLHIIYQELDLSKLEQTGTDPAIDMAKIKKAYYSNINIDVSKDLTVDKLKEVIETLHAKTKIYINDIKELLGHKDDHAEEKIQLIAEYRGFDYIYQRYKLEREEIEKALVQQNLSLIEK
jgi:hypothetical protein